MDDLESKEHAKMTKITRFVIGGLIIFLVLVAWQGYSSYKALVKARQEIERLKLNQQQLLAEKQQETYLLLTQKELTGKVLAERDSLAKALKIRPKEIIKFVDRIITEHDTVITEVESTWLKDMSWHLTDGDKCWKWEADAQLDGNDLNVNRTLFDYRNKSSEVYWWQRRKFIGLKIGRKEYYQKVLPECGEMTVRSIEIKKK